MQDVAVITLDGASVPLESLWADGPAVIVWLRHYG